MYTIRRTLLLLLCAITFAAIAVGQAASQQPEVHLLKRLGQTPPLRNLPPMIAPDGRRVIPIHPLPQKPETIVTDTVQQTSASPLVATTGGLNFEGVGNGAYGYAVHVAPPDTNGAAGATQYVQWVNLAFAVFDKSTGNLLYGPAAGNTLWQGSSLSACAANNDGDVIAQYDKAAGRWWMSQLSYTGAPPYYLCIAVSATSDALGSWYLYALEWTSDTLPDYPKVGIWPDGYYISVNLFYAEILFVGAQACALQRDAMLNNLDAGVVCFTQSSYASLLPSDLDGSNPPPAGSPNFYVTLGSGALGLFRFHVDWANPSNSSMTGPFNIPVAAFNKACGGGTCIPQPNTTQQLDSLADRLMYRLAYRNFGDHESLLVSHSVATGGSKKRASGSGVRWYEIRNPNGSPSVFQQGTFAPDSNFRWMPSIAMDKVGDMAVGYSVSSGSVYPSIRYTGRVPSDPLGTLEAENSIIEGSGSQLSNLSRWGDYSSMAIDPGDDCTFWYTTEYLQQSGTFNWNTRIASFKFPGCQ